MKNILSFIEAYPTAHYPLSLQVSLLAYRLGRKALSADEKDFFDWLIEKIPNQMYLELQNKYLSFEDKETSHFISTSSFHKYLDLPYWMHSKFLIGQRTGLCHFPPPLNILDIGSGPCHFGAVSKYFGHHYTGLDKAKQSDPKSSLALSFYSDMANIFDLDVWHHRTMYDKPLPPNLPLEPFDLIVALMSTFCVHDGKPWGAAHWESWFTNLFATNAFKSSTTFYFKLAAKYFGYEAREWFKVNGIEVHATASVLIFSDNSLRLFRYIYNPEPLVYS